MVETGREEREVTSCRGASASTNVTKTHQCLQACSPSFRETGCCAAGANQSHMTPTNITAENGHLHTTQGCKHCQKMKLTVVASTAGVHLGAGVGTGWTFNSPCYTPSPSPPPKKNLLALCQYHCLGQLGEF